MLRVCLDSGVAMDVQRVLAETSQRPEEPGRFVGSEAGSSIRGAVSGVLRGDEDFVCAQWRDSNRPYPDRSILIFVVDPNKTPAGSATIGDFQEQIHKIDGFRPHPAGNATVALYTDSTDPGQISKMIARVVPMDAWMVAGAVSTVGVISLNPAVKHNDLAAQVRARKTEQDTEARATLEGGEWKWGEEDMWSFYDRPRIDHLPEDERNAKVEELKLGLMRQIEGMNIERGKAVEYKLENPPTFAGFSLSSVDNVQDAWRGLMRFAEAEHEDAKNSPASYDVVALFGSLMDLPEDEQDLVAAPDIGDRLKGSAQAEQTATDPEWSAFLTRLRVPVHGDFAMWKNEITGGPPTLPPPTSGPSKGQRLGP